MKILLLGYSNIAKKRIINFFIKEKFTLSVASKSYRKKIRNIYQQYHSYETALNQSKADLVYISLPNSTHFKWAQKALLAGYHVVVDKPLCNTTSELTKLVNIAHKKNRLLTEATFFNYHFHFKKISSLIKNYKNIKEIHSNFIIPMPKKNSLLLSKKFKGGALMDMGPYAAAVVRIFCNQKIYSHKVYIKKTKDNLIKSFKILINFKHKIYLGNFQFGGSYKNELSLHTKKNIITLNRVFSPPANKNLYLDIESGKILKRYKISKDDCFANFFNEVKKNIKTKKYFFYEDRIKFDNYFRNKILKKNFISK